MPSEMYTFYSLAVESGDYLGNLGYSIFQMLPTIESCSKHSVFRIASTRELHSKEMPMTVNKKVCGYRFWGARKMSDVSAWHT